MELKKDVKITREQARQLIRDMTGYSLAVRNVVTFNMQIARQLDRPTSATGPGPFVVRRIARLPEVPQSLKDMLK